MMSWSNRAGRRSTSGMSSTRDVEPNRRILRMQPPLAPVHRVARIGPRRRLQPRPVAMSLGRAAGRGTPEAYQLFRTNG